MALRLLSTSARGIPRSLALQRAAGAPAFVRNQKRLVSHYNVALAGLTEEQTEVRTVPSWCNSTLTLLSLCVIVPGGHSPIR